MTAVDDRSRGRDSERPKPLTSPAARRRRSFWVDSNISCSGKITGLGNTQAVRITIEATRVCTNRGSNDPPGQVSGQRAQRILRERTIVGEPA